MGVSLFRKSTWVRMKEAVVSFMIQLYQVDVDSLEAARWLVFIHQVSPKPAYLRVKVSRRLARVGAVALKNTVYVLPRSDGALEDFQWLLREVVGEGGEATLLQAHLIDGVTDAEVEALFRRARDADYADVLSDARALAQRLDADELTEETRRQAEADLLRLTTRVDEIARIDFFQASGRQSTERQLSMLRERITQRCAPKSAPHEHKHAQYQARTWVTRKGVHVDRIASAWLIRRFIDPQASFKFVPAQGYKPERDELRFDMFEAEFSHEGDQCTFEVLCARFDLRDSGLLCLAELIHDIDIKDGKFGRPETAGFAAQISGIAHLCPEDEQRIYRGSQVCEELLSYFTHKKE